MELFPLDSRIIDIHGIVGGASTGRGGVRDETGETDRASVDVKAASIIIAEEFTAHLGNAIDGFGALNSVLWSLDMGSRGAERADRTWGKEGALLLTSHLESVVKSTDADLPSELRTGFSHSREKGGKIVDSIDMILINSSGDLISVSDINHFSRTTFEEYTLRLGAIDITTHYMIVAINATKLHD